MPSVRITSSGVTIGSELRTFNVDGLVLDNTLNRTLVAPEVVAPLIEGTTSVTSPLVKATKIGLGGITNPSATLHSDGDAYFIKDNVRVLVGESLSGGKYAGYKWISPSDSFNIGHSGFDSNLEQIKILSDGTTEFYGNAEFTNFIPRITYTVATLPTGILGMTVYVTDLTTPTYLAVAVGGGAISSWATYNGTNWVT